MTFSDLDKKRLTHLEENIARCLDLLQELEKGLSVTNFPVDSRRYRDEIVRQENFIAEYKEEYAKLQQKLTGQPSAPQIKNVGNQLQQMDAKLNLLLIVQGRIYKDLLNELDAIELDLTQKLQDALDSNQVSEPQMQQMLALLEERIPSLTPNQAAIAKVIKDPELDAKHKLKVTLPIVPMLVKYEGELELGSGFNIRSAWDQLVAKLQLQSKKKVKQRIRES